MTTTWDILDAVGRRIRGPASAIAVLRNGELVAERVWGFADLDGRVPMIADTQIPICSITNSCSAACQLTWSSTHWGNSRRAEASSGSS